MTVGVGTARVKLRRSRRRPGGRGRRRGRRRSTGGKGWAVRGVAVALLAVGLWAVQMAVLSWRLSPFDWSEYWFWRGLYRPGLTLAAAVASGAVDGGLGRRPLRPLDPAGARLGFQLAAAVYAVVGATVVAGVVGLAGGRGRRR